MINSVRWLAAICRQLYQLIGLLSRISFPAADRWAVPCSWSVCDVEQRFINDDATLTAAHRRRCLFAHPYFSGGDGTCDQPQRESLMDYSRPQRHGGVVFDVTTVTQ